MSDHTDKTATRTRDLPPEAGPREVFVEGEAAGFAQSITVGAHRLASDEPVALGGTDTGPGPYDLLLAALGSCTSMTIAMYARRKKWPLESVRVRLRHGKIHAADCADCETREGKLDRIEREVELVGPLDDAQRARLLDIANKCPVHRTLRAEIVIETRAIGPGAG
jgi:putative redox protein